MVRFNRSCAISYRADRDLTVAGMQRERKRYQRERDGSTGKNRLVLCKTILKTKQDIASTYTGCPTTRPLRLTIHNLKTPELICMIFDTI